MEQIGTLLISTRRIKSKFQLVVHAAVVDSQKYSEQGCHNRGLSQLKLYPPTVLQRTITLSVSADLY